RAGNRRRTSMKWAKPWLTGFWAVILITTLTVPAWAESFADLHIERGEVDVLNDVDFKTSVAFGEPLLTSPEFPKTRLQPYLTVGPPDGSADFFPSEQSVTDTSVRMKVGAGVSWSPLRNIAIFGEYTPELQFKDRAEPTTLEPDVNTHHMVGGGISFRFGSSRPGVLDHE
ncbi:MAG TPA: hypothetical protein VFM04_08570, partial [Candidatus Methylomirabilis sp.]|nr:hypothetical protein [Candidatus Methylomirabilis sp.]